MTENAASINYKCLVNKKIYRNNKLSSTINNAESFVNNSQSNLMNFCAKSSSKQKRSTIYIVFLTFFELLYQQILIILKNIYLFLCWGDKRVKNQRKVRFEVIDCSENVILSESLNCIKTTDKKVNFSLSHSYIVVSDIINSTYLYNENPLKMKREVDMHDELALNALRKYNGHVVANEGDSFSVVFETLENAVEFSKNFTSQIKAIKSNIKIRIGINSGFMNVRKYFGYKCFGKPIDEINEFTKHNIGDKICIKGILLEGTQYQMSHFCIH